MRLKFKAMPRPGTMRSSKWCQNSPVAVFTGLAHEQVVGDVLGNPPPVVAEDGGGVEITLVNVTVSPLPRTPFSVLPFRVRLRLVHLANEQLFMYQRPCCPE
jgi:hypothetical protein